MTKCPHCASGNQPRFREATGEWVHDYVIRQDLPFLKATVSHTVCHDPPKAPSLDP